MVPEGSIKLVHQESRLNTRDQVASSIKRGKNVVHMSKNDPADLRELRSSQTYSFSEVNILGKPLYQLHFVLAGDNREKGTELGMNHNRVFMSRDLRG